MSVIHIVNRFSAKPKYTLGKVAYKSHLNNLFGYSNGNSFTFSMMMTPDYHRLYLNKKNVVPYIIDYWRRYDEMFEKYFVQFPIVYISGLEAYEYLKSRNTKVNLKHLPLSISDKCLDFFNIEVEKSIDIVNIGRKNMVIDDYIQQYISKYPSTNYVHRIMENGENIYYSSIHGKIGKLESRNDLLETLSKSKIAIVTSPGLDGGEIRTTGFNPVTPRVFEAAVGKCYMIGRYDLNHEFYSFGLDKLVGLPKSYEEFESMVNNKLNTKFDQEESYNSFLQENLNSKRIEQVVRDTSSEVNEFNLEYLNILGSAF